MKETAVKKSVPDILEQAAETFRERNKVYGDNYRLVGPVLNAMFPHGVKLTNVEDFERWHLFELMIVKLTRFATSGLTHHDSIHDAAVYAAMVEFLLSEKSHTQSINNAEDIA